MRNSTLLTLLGIGLPVLPVSAQSDCWTTTKPTCRNAFANKDAAHTAIAKACDAIPTCTPGTPPSPATVTGTHLPISPYPDPT